MIVSTKDDIVRLEGSLVKNHWLTIKAAATQLLEAHPQGIVIDCSELEHVSEDGAKTFLEAMKDIRAAGARIVVANLPENVLQVLRSVPGVRSQLPIASSVEEARASLRRGGSVAATDVDHPETENCILVPLVEGLDIEYEVTLAGRIPHDMRRTILLVSLLQVARNLPIDTPLPDEERAANQLLDQAQQAARRQNLLCSSRIERVRDVQEGLLQIIRNYKALYVVLSVSGNRLGEDHLQSLMNALLYRAPCNVLIGRKASDSSSLTSAALYGEV